MCCFPGLPPFSLCSKRKFLAYIQCLYIYATTNTVNPKKERERLKRPKPGATPKS